MLLWLKQAILGLIESLFKLTLKVIYSYFLVNLALHALMAMYRDLLALIILSCLFLFHPSISLSLDDLSLRKL